MAFVKEIREDLRRGLHLDNLSNLGSQCMNLARTQDQPLAFYILAKVFDDIYNEFADHPLPTATLQRVEEGITDKLDRVLASVDGNETCEKIWVELNELLKGVRMSLESKAEYQT